MFVSSYTTHIQSDISSKDSRQRLQKPNASSESFSQKLAQKTPTPNFTNSPIPIDYISKGQAHTNRQELEFQKEQLKNPDKSSAKEMKESINKLSAHNSMAGAKNAYENINKAFSSFPKQALSMDQTPKMDKNLPEEALQAKELTMKHQMVNTYISNDNYYRVTA